MDSFSQEVSYLIRVYFVPGILPWIQTIASSLALSFPVGFYSPHSRQSPSLDNENCIGYNQSVSLLPFSPYFNPQKVMGEILPAVFSCSVHKACSGLGGFRLQESSPAGPFHFTNQFCYLAVTISALAREICTQLIPLLLLMHIHLEFSSLFSLAVHVPVFLL